MQINLLLEHYQLLVHLNLQVVSSSLQLCLKLVHLFLLVFGQLFTLILGVLEAQIFNSFSLLYLKLFQLLSVVHGLFDSLIVGYKFLVVLHLL